MRRAVGFAVLAAPLLLLRAAAGCEATSTAPPFSDDPSEDAGIGGNTGSDGGGGEVTLPCVDACSADNTAVVDCKGNTLEACAAPAVCYEASCTTEPCAVAAATGSQSGCEFWIWPSISLADGACGVAYVANTSLSSAQVTVEVNETNLPVGGSASVTTAGGLPLSDYDATLGIPPGEVGIISLHPARSGATDMCLKPPLTSLSAASMTSLQSGLAIRSSAPTVVYYQSPDAYVSTYETSAATTVLPAHSLGYDYVIAAPDDHNPAGGAPGFAVLATADNTTIDFTPAKDVAENDPVPAFKAGVSGTMALKRGEAVMFLQEEDLSGSLLRANRPVSVWGVHSFDFSTPVGNCCGDSDFQQLVPREALGSKYAGVGHKSRTDPFQEYIHWRMVGAADGTVLTWEPSKPFDGPATLSLGEVVDFAVGTPFVVSSQDKAHPFCISQFMTTGGVGGTGDPEWLNVVAPEQFATSYRFYVPPTHPIVNLVVIRTAGADGTFSPVNLDCAGELSDWTPLGEYEYTRFDFSEGDFSTAVCQPGAHGMESESPFGLVVWGWGSKTSVPPLPGSSYAFSGAAYAKAISTVDIPE